MNLQNLLLKILCILIAMACSQFIMSGEDGNLLVRIVLILIVYFPLYFILLKIKEKFWK